jgi:hypothetical protein
MADGAVLYRPASLCIMAVWYDNLCHTRLYPLSQGLRIQPQAAEEIFNDDVTVFSSTSNLCFMMFTIWQTIKATVSQDDLAEHKRMHRLTGARDKPEG